MKNHAVRLLLDGGGFRLWKAMDEATQSDEVGGGCLVRLLVRKGVSIPITGLGVDLPLGFESYKGYREDGDFVFQLSKKVPYTSGSGKLSCIR